MPTLKIDGVGNVKVGDEFLSYSPERQALEVDSIASMLRSSQSQSPAPPFLGANGEPLPIPAPTAQPPQEPGIGAAVGRVASSAVSGAADKFGDRPIGLSDETIKNMRENGTLAPEGRLGTPIQLLNEIVYRYGATAGDALLRAIAGGVGAVGGAAGQTAVEAGADPAMGKRLERDVGMLADTAGIVSGSPAALRQQAAAKAFTATQRAAAADTAAQAAPAIAKTTDEFKTAAKSFYQQAEDAGVVIKPDSYRALSSDISKTAEKAGLDPTLTPDSTAALKRIQELAKPEAGPISFKKLDQMRQIASDAGASPKPSDRRVAGIIVDKIDEYVSGLGGKDVVSGDAKSAASAIVQARDMWSKAAKLSAVERLVDRAQTSAGTFSGSGFENALRTEFRILAKNDSKMRTFTPEEQAAIKQVARGTVGTNVARNIGKLAARGIVSGTLSGGSGAAIGTAIGIGPMAGTAASFGIGEIGRKLATVLTQRSIRQLEDKIRTGGNSEMAAAAVKRGNATAARLLTGGGAAGIFDSIDASQNDRNR